MEKWVKIVLLIIGISCAMTFLSLYLTSTYTTIMQNNESLFSHPYGIMLGVFGGIFVITCFFSGMIFAAEGDGY